MGGGAMSSAPWHAVFHEEREAHRFAFKNGGHVAPVFAPVLRPYAEPGPKVEILASAFPRCSVCGSEEQGTHRAGTQPGFCTGSHRAPWVNRDLKERAERIGCKPAWADGIFGWSWHCSCTGNPHGCDQQCSTITDESLRTFEVKP
jgi:hypothetical protein